jgi:hypothetical protein
LPFPLLPDKPYPDSFIFHGSLIEDCPLRTGIFSVYASSPLLGNGSCLLVRYPQVSRWRSVGGSG